MQTLLIKRQRAFFAFIAFVAFIALLRLSNLMLRIGSENRFAGLELSAEKRHWKLVALATGIYQTVYCVYCVCCVIALIAFVAFIAFVAL